MAKSKRASPKVKRAPTRAAPQRSSGNGKPSGSLTPKKQVRKRAFGGPLVRQHEAVWVNGRVPSGYWDLVENRRLYVRWLGQQLGFRKADDWYRITTGDFKRNSGGGLLQQHWSSSAIGAVKETFPGRRRSSPEL